MVFVELLFVGNTRADEVELLSSASYWIRHQLRVCLCSSAKECKNVSGLAVLVTAQGFEHVGDKLKFFPVVRVFAESF